MNNIRFIVASMVAGLFAVGCTAPVDMPDDENLGEAQQALPTNATLTTYYSEAAHIHEVGHCLSPSLCTGSTTTCSGIKTVYKTTETVFCN